MKFGCTGCGLCCKTVGLTLRNIEKIEEPYKTELYGFPFSSKRDGSCEKLNKDGKCDVYNDRPDLCNVEVMYKKYFSKEVTKKQYFKKASVACNKLILNFGYSDKYLIKD